MANHSVRFLAHSSTANSTNFTFLDPELIGGFYPHEGPIGVTVLMVSLLTIGANGIVITSFAKTKQLRTSFNIHLLNLSLADSLQALFAGPGYFVLFWFNSWPLGRLLCTLRLWITSFSASLILHIHCTICLNRLIAVTFPVFYKNHNSRVAKRICYSLWLYVNVWTTGLINDHRFYRVDSVWDCAPNYGAQGLWFTWYTSIAFHAPTFITVFVYPAILYKVFRTHKRRAKPENRVVLSAVIPTDRICRGKSSVLAASINEAKARTTIKEQSELQLQTSTSATSSSNLTLHQEFASQLRTKRRENKKTKLQSDSGSHLTILTLLMVGASICWIPISVIGIWENATRSIFEDVMVNSIVTMLFFISSLLNPFFYAFASEEWRNAFKRTLHLT